jgi:hypothetical protein
MLIQTTTVNSSLRNVIYTSYFLFKLEIFLRKIIKDKKFNLKSKNCITILRFQKVLYSGLSSYSLRFCEIKVWYTIKVCNKI